MLLPCQGDTQPFIWIDEVIVVVIPEIDLDPLDLAAELALGHPAAAVSRHTQTPSVVRVPGVKRWMTDHWSTAGAVLVGGGLTAAFGNIASQSFLDWNDPSRINADFARGTLGFGGGADPGQTAQNTTAIITVIFGSVVIVCTILVIGLALRKIWAREGALFVFGLLGLVSVAASLAGFAAEPPAPSAEVGMLTGIANFAVVAFLLMPASRLDFDPFADYHRASIHSQV